MYFSWAVSDERLIEMGIDPNDEGRRFYYVGMFNETYNIRLARKDMEDCSAGERLNLLYQLRDGYNSEEVLQRIEKGGNYEDETLSVFAKNLDPEVWEFGSEVEKEIRKYERLLALESGAGVVDITVENEKPKTQEENEKRSLVRTRDRLSLIFHFMFEHYGLELSQKKKAQLISDAGGFSAKKIEDSFARGQFPARLARLVETNDGDIDPETDKFREDIESVESWFRLCGLKEIADEVRKSIKNGHF